jgi:hypothetical protein
MVGHILVSDVADRQGKFTYLAITQEQRQELIRGLDAAFGESRLQSPQGPQSYVEAAATILYQVLSGRHRSSNER